MSGILVREPDDLTVSDLRTVYYSNTPLSLPTSHSSFYAGELLSRKDVLEDDVIALEFCLATLEAVLPSSLSSLVPTHLDLNVSDSKSLSQLLTQFCNGLNPVPKPPVTGSVASSAAQSLQRIVLRRLRALFGAHESQLNALRQTVRSIDVARAELDRALVSAKKSLGEDSLSATGGSTGIEEKTLPKGKSNSSQSNVVERSQNDKKQSQQLEIEKEKEKESRQKELENQREKELHRSKELEKEKELHLQKEKEIQREREVQREKEIEKKKEIQKEKELRRERELSEERSRKLAEEREKKAREQAELEKEKQKVKLEEHKTSEVTSLEQRVDHKRPLPVPPASEETKKERTTVVAASTRDDSEEMSEGQRELERAMAAERERLRKEQLRSRPSTSVDEWLPGANDNDAAQNIAVMGTSPKPANFVTPLDNISDDILPSTSELLPSVEGIFKISSDQRSKERELSREQKAREEADKKREIEAKRLGLDVQGFFEGNTRDEEQQAQREREQQRKAKEDEVHSLEAQRLKEEKALTAAREEQRLRDEEEKRLRDERLKDEAKVLESARDDWSRNGSADMPQTKPVPINPSSAPPAPTIFDKPSALVEKKRPKESHDPLDDLFGKSASTSGSLKSTVDSLFADEDGDDSILFPMSNSPSVTLKPSSSSLSSSRGMTMTLDDDFDSLFSVKR